MTGLKLIICNTCRHFPILYHCTSRTYDNSCRRVHTRDAFSHFYSSSLWDIGFWSVGMIFSTFSPTTQDSVTSIRGSFAGRWKWSVRAAESFNIWAADNPPKGGCELSSSGECNKTTLGRTLDFSRLKLFFIFVLVLLNMDPATTYSMYSKGLWVAFCFSWHEGRNTRFPTHYLLHVLKRGIMGVVGRFLLQLARGQNYAIPSGAQSARRTAHLVDHIN